MNWDSLEVNDDHGRCHLNISESNELEAEHWKFAFLFIDSIKDQVLNGVSDGSRSKLGAGVSGVSSVGVTSFEVTIWHTSNLPGLCS